MLETYICNIIFWFQQELRGAATLSYLHRLTIAYMEPPASHSLLKYLTKNASAPYFQSIKEWIFNGIIFDPFEEVSSESF